MSGKNTLSDAELTVMKLLWRAGEPLPSAEIAKQLEPETGWSFSTVSTLLGRMAEKQAIGHEKRGKAYYYRPLIAEDDYKKAETRSFLFIMNIQEFLKGILIGVAKIIPGLSGSVLMISFNLYDKAIDSITNFFKDIKANFLFLANLSIGIIIGIVIFSNILNYFINNYFNIII